MHESLLARHPRLRLIDGATPVQRLHRVEAALGTMLRGARLFVKRDDLMSLGGGGSKLRKLEFVIGDAVAQGADTLVAAGPCQSNSARLTAAAAARSGLDCELVLTGLTPGDSADYRRNGNVLLNRLFGARVHEAADAVLARSLAQERCKALTATGRRPFMIPPGASSAVAALGYAACAFEIAGQETVLRRRFDRVIIANGSSGSHAGLVAGFAALGRAPSSITGFSVFSPVDEARSATLEHARAALRLLGCADAIDDDDVVVHGQQRGEGYGRITAQGVAAMRFMAAREGLLLDPVYSAKAFAGLLALARQGEFRPGENILFVMTGGSPALFAYRDQLDDLAGFNPSGAGIQKARPDLSLQGVSSREQS